MSSDVAAAHGAVEGGTRDFGAPLTALFTINGVAFVVPELRSITNAAGLMVIHFIG